MHSCIDSTIMSHTYHVEKGNPLHDKSTHSFVDSP